MCRFRCFSTVVYLAIFLNNVLCKTIYLELNNPSKEQLTFLEKYGYLPERSNGLDFAYTAQSVAEAVRKMQAFAGLPQTGELDEETRQLFKKRRCGIKDIDNSLKTRSRRYVVQQSWNKRYITYRVINGSRTLPKPRVEELVGAALALWAPHGGLVFHHQPDRKADIDIFFATGEHGDGFPFDGVGNVVAHAFPPPHGEMHFDDAEVWGEGGSDDDATDLFAVALHEAGHALGLAHSSERSAVMYPYYLEPVYGLHSDDILGMQKLYSPFGLSVTEERRPPATPAPADDYDLPDLCYTNYDTVQAIHGSIYVFEEEWMWVLKDRAVQEGSPRRIHAQFRGLPARVTAVRTIYERQNGHVVIFSGRRYWEFNTTFSLVKTGRLTDYGLPRRVAELSTVFLSNYNNKTYLIEYERFWRFDEAIWSMDRGYPKDMAAWRQVPYPVDAALIWKGDTYFFRGPRFWRFDNTLVAAHPHYPLPTAQVWLPCAPDETMVNYFTNEEP